MSGRVKRSALATLAGVRAERDARWQRELRREAGGPLGKYVLDGREIVQAPFLEWAEWFEHAHVTGARIVKHERTHGRFVSTVFLGIDHRFAGTGEGPPLLFETMVFDEADEGTGSQGRDLGQWRWSTFAEARGWPRLHRVRCQGRRTARRARDACSQLTGGSNCRTRKGL